MHLNQHATKCLNVEKFLEAWQDDSRLPFLWTPDLRQAPDPRGSVSLWEGSQLYCHLRHHALGRACGVSMDTVALSSVPMRLGIFINVFLGLRVLSFDKSQVWLLGEEVGVSAGNMVTMDVGTVGSKWPLFIRSVIG